MDLLKTSGPQDHLANLIHSGQEIIKKNNVKNGMCFIRTVLHQSCDSYLQFRKLHYLGIKFLRGYLFLWGHELANSFCLFRLQRNFLQMIIDF